MKQLGILSITLMWLGTYAMLRAHISEGGKSLSQHASKNHHFHLGYALVEIGVTSMFSVFLFGWFVPHLHLPLVFSTCAALAVTGAVIAAIVPDRPGWPHKIHTVGAYGMAALFVPIVALINLDQNVSLIGRWIAGLITAYYFIGWLIAFYRPRALRNRLLLYQVIYYVSFHVTILAATYT